MHIYFFVFQIELSFFFFRLIEVTYFSHCSNALTRSFNFFFSRSMIFLVHLPKLNLKIQNLILGLPSSSLLYVMSA